MFYFDVPKLGCYLAVPLDYQTCLFDRAFIKGVENTIEVRRLRAEQEAEAEAKSARGSANS
jgi:hypothetical protein